MIKVKVGTRVIYYKKYRLESKISLSLFHHLLAIVASDHDIIIRVSLPVSRAGANNQQTPEAATYALHAYQRLGV